MKMESYKFSEKTGRKGLPQGVYNFVKSRVESQEYGSEKKGGRLKKHGTYRNQKDNREGQGSQGQGLSMFSLLHQFS